MKYCISARQPAEILKQADEIKLKYKDNDILFDYIDKYPNATFIVELAPEDEPKWKNLEVLNGKSGGRIIIALNYMTHKDICRQYNLKYYWKYPAATYMEARSLIECGVCYLLITAPLTHNLHALNYYEIPLRMIPNIAYDNYIPRANGVCGQYVRPEDTEIYEPYITTFEFIAQDAKKERTLFEIYKARKWNGNLDLLITNLGVAADNRAFPPEFAQKRISCKQRCQEPNKYCDYCAATFRLIETGRQLAQRKRGENYVEN